MDSFEVLGGPVQTADGAKAYALGSGQDDRGCYLMRTTDALSRSSGLGLLRLALPRGFCADVLQQMAR